MLNSIERWIWSPLESCESPMVEDWQACAQANGCTPDQVAQAADMAGDYFPEYDLPVCRQYCSQWLAPFHGDGFALVYCEMDITHLAAAQQDPRLTIYRSLDDQIDPSVAAAYSSFLPPPDTQLKTVSAPAAATLADLLQQLEQLHILFSATE